MGRLLWCRHDDCRRPYWSEAGCLPRLCPECTRPALWTSTAPMEQDDPPPLVFAGIDRVILIYLGIGLE
jgi:hypothetical protein